MSASTVQLEPLGKHIKRIAKADPTAYGPRTAKRGGVYTPFLPAPISKRPFPLGDEAAAAVAQATRALAQLGGVAPRLSSLDALARSVLRAESVASSRIEGVRISHKRLARVAHTAESGRASDPRAVEVLGNVAAMEKAIEIGAKRSALAVADIEDIHRMLLRFTEDRDIAGIVRNRQNWIGGNDYNPVGADYVPPPPGKVRELLEDLCAFIDRGDLAPTAQAAIAHAQFENIHPFADGNGRTGRALIYTVLRRRGEIQDFIPPISLVLASQPKAYVGGFGAYSLGKVDVWCERFANATARASLEAQSVADAIEDCEADWLERLGHPRSDSAVRQLVRELPAHPVVDAGVAEALTRKSHTAVHNALNQLEDAGILQPLNEKKWGRAWEAGELLQLVADFEKRVSTTRP